MYILQVQEELPDFEVPMVTLELLVNRDRSAHEASLDHKETLASPVLVVSLASQDPQAALGSRDQLATLEQRVNRVRLDSPVILGQLVHEVRPE